MERTALPLVDTHAHLAMLKHDGLDVILARARGEGVKRMVSVSTLEGDWDANQAVAEKETDIYYSLGVHPHETATWNDVKPRLAARFPGDKAPAKCVGIGETGLDFYYNHASREDQINAFEDHLKLAKRVNLPVIIHCRDSFPELFASIRKVGLGPARAIMHCFTGNWDQAKESVDLGLMISFSGIVTFKNAAAIRDAAKQLPDTAICIETDCPYLAPVPNRGKPNEPSYLRHTLEMLASVRGVSESALAARVFQNSLEFFKLPS